MIHRLVHLLVGLGVALLAFGGWMAFTSNPQTTHDTPTQQQATHTSSRPAAPTSPSTRPTTPNDPTFSSTTSPSSSSTPASETSTSTTPNPRALRVERASAVKTARAFLGDLTARGRDPKEWWRALEPQLSPQARTDMAGMQPQWVPPLELKPGGGVVVDEDAAVNAHQREVEVAVPTRSGWAGVFLRPAPGGGDYVVVRYDLPEGGRDGG